MPPKNASSVADGESRRSSACSAAVQRKAPATSAYPDASRTAWCARGCSADTTSAPACGRSSASTMVRSGDSRLPRVHSGTGAAASKRKAPASSAAITAK
ncbi:hypothetical protein PSR1_04461 [Anaeromyxobacter sp. PSR-1]|nr:hypothetical protein PSR1_04461 [Anaeromyxobacter sp. PSR-1]